MKPVYRVVAINKNDKEQRFTVGTIWPFRGGGKNLSLSLVTDPKEEFKEKCISDLQLDDFYLNVYAVGAPKEEGPTPSESDVDIDGDSPF